MGQVISILCSELEGILRSLVEREENEARTNQVINKKNNTIAMAKEESSSVVSDLINFLNASPTAFHAVGTFLSFFLSLTPFSVCFRRKSNNSESHFPIKNQMY